MPILNFDYVVGIDPGAKTGLAIWSVRQQEFVYLVTTNYEGALRIMSESGSWWSAIGDVLVLIEDPRMISAIYSRHQAAAKSTAVLTNIAQKVGMNKADAKALAEKLRAVGFRVMQIKPRGKKWKADIFTRITKWKGRSSEHSRDAARFVYGHTGIVAIPDNK